MTETEVRTLVTPRLDVILTAIEERNDDELDGTTRVEAVRETEAAFKAAGKSNLTISPVFLRLHR